MLILVYFYIQSYPIYLLLSLLYNYFVVATAMATALLVSVDKIRSYAREKRRTPDGNTRTDDQLEAARAIWSPKNIQF